MEEVNKKNPPNLPPNYVTLVQLRERWMKEQKRKQEEKARGEEKNDVVLGNNEKPISKGMKDRNYQEKKEKSVKEEGKKENEKDGAETEGKIVSKKGGDDVAEGSDRTVEIKEKLECVKVEDENGVSRREKSGYIRNINGYNVKSGRDNGRYGRRNGEFSWYDRDFALNGNQKVWVKKEHVVGVKDGKFS